MALAFSGIMAKSLPPQNLIQQTFDSDLQAGRLLKTGEFQERAGWTGEALNEALQARRVFFIEVGGVRAFPAFYLDQRYNRQELEALTELLGNLTGGSKWAFFTQPKGSLALATSTEPIDRTPLEALEAGDIEPVRRAATGYAER